MLPRRISLESAIDEWLEALRLTKPRPHGWQSDFDATGWGDTELPELLRARRNDDLQGPTVNESHRRECMRLWTTAILSEQRESGARRKQLDITDLGSEALLNATQALCRRLTGSDYDDLAGRHGMIVIGGESIADPAPPESVRKFAEHLVVMDEFCRWATWRGYFRFDPFAESRPSTAAVKTYHGGPALDSSYFIDVALSGGGHRAAL